eukprot:jgi/Mesen1/5129/ME000255S04103
MARLFRPKDQVSAYRDRRFKGTQEEFQEALQTSTTVYIGNLSFYTTEEQIYEVFSRTGEIKRIVMGLDKNSMTPCGFCFVMYYTREDAEDAVKFISGTILDERPVRVDFDWGFQDGRQWGRGRSGGQVRDEGGYGKLVQHELEVRRFAPSEFGSPPGMPPGGPMAAPFTVPFPSHGGRKRGREDAQVPPPDGVRAMQLDSPGAPPPAKNPRFRERGDDSDDEDGPKH